MLKASNGTLYVAIDGKVANEKTTEFRMSKEAKVKIPKSAKAPTVKVDYVKGTLGLKNGMHRPSSPCRRHSRRCPPARSRP